MAGITKFVARSCITLLALEHARFPADIITSEVNRLHLKLFPVADLRTRVYTDGTFLFFEASLEAEEKV